MKNSLRDLACRSVIEAIRQNEDSVFVSGGLCLLRGKYVLIRNSSASAREKIIVLATALKHLDFDNIYIRPVVTWERIDKTEKTSLKGAQKGVTRKVARVF